MSKRAKAIGYIRVASSTEAGQDKSLVMQKDKILKAAKRSNVEIVEWFAESANTPKRYRKRVLDAALLYCQVNNSIKYLVISEPSRLSRQLEEFQYWKVAFERIGVNIASIDLDAVTPMYCFSKSVVVLPSELYDTNKLAEIGNLLSKTMKGKEE